jgi:hypothetical protein
LRQQFLARIGVARLIGHYKQQLLQHRAEHCSALGELRRVKNKTSEQQSE